MDTTTRIGTSFYSTLHVKGKSILYIHFNLGWESHLKIFSDGALIIMVLENWMQCFKSSTTFCTKHGWGNACEREEKWSVNIMWAPLLLCFFQTFQLYAFLCVISNSPLIIFLLVIYLMLRECIDSSVDYLKYLQRINF